MSSIIAAYDKTLFYNEAGKYCVLRLKTADPMVPEDARDKYRFADHLIRFVAVGYDLPRTDAIKMELDGAWVSGKYGPQFQVDSWHELVPPTIEGVLGYLSSGLLKGIGPKTAGEIVQRFGTDSLNVIETQPEKLLGEALVLLNEKIPQLDQRLQRPQLERELRTMIETNVVVSKKGSIYLPHVFNQESETARKVAEMVLEWPEPVDLRPVMERIRGRLGITLSPMQYRAVEMAFRHNLSIITGGPGTGKSTILKAVIEAYRELYPKDTIALGAPTGKASRRMAETTGMDSAATLHSLLGLHGEDAGWQEKKPLEADFLIVDEASMVDMWLAYQVFTRLKPETKVLIVGDADQLESVGAGSVFRELIQCGLVPVTVLDQIFRQGADSLIAYNAKFIREGSGQLRYGRDFSLTETESQEETAALIRVLYRGALGHTAMEQVQILTPFRATGDASANNLNAAIQAEVNLPDISKPELSNGGRLFRLGDRVMQIKNDYDVALYDEEGHQLAAGVFNGEVGIVSGVQPGTLTVCFDGRYADYPLESLGELELAYATTVHKSQGSEYDTVIVPVLPAHRILLTRNLLYTAITRAKRRVVLVGMKKAIFMAAGRCSTGKRNTLLGERIQLYYQALSRRNTPAGEEELKNAS